MTRKRLASFLLSAKPYGLRWFLPVVGFFSAVWFLVRVVPKPSRATYPCQRVAFPFASGFVIWLTGMVVSALAFRKAKRAFANACYVVAFLCVLTSIMSAWIALSHLEEKTTSAAAPIPNAPVGTPRGLHPGRVVWVQDRSTTYWDGPGSGDGYLWEPEHTKQFFVNEMMSRTLRDLAGESTDSDAWDKLFQHFNDQQGRGNRGYQAGEKITIKVNMTTCNHDHLLWIIDPFTYDKIDYLDKADTMPQMIIALLRQLVLKVGVNESDISVGDTVTYFPNQWWDLCHGEFPGVEYFDHIGRLARKKVTSSNVVQHWSHSEGGTYLTDYIPASFAQADYVINLAVLKGHTAGITLCAKNNYGSYIRRPNDEGYYDLHNSIAGINPGVAQYRALVDMMGHPHMGGKTLLYLIDGLYGGYYWEGTPYKFQMSPFNNDWPSSLLASQDPVAIDSVGLDILWQESSIPSSSWYGIADIGGVDDYLYEAALADNPPSGTFYDPNNDGVGLQSLGVHERWNNPTDMEYTQIELIKIEVTEHSPDFNQDGIVDVIDLDNLSASWLDAFCDESNDWCEKADFNRSGAVNIVDFIYLSRHWLGSP